MSTNVFINLHVRDLAASIAFFEKLGFAFDPQLTNEQAGCMVINEHAYALLVTESFFRTVTDRELADTATVHEVALAIDAENRERVDELVDTALSAGGQAAGEPQDEGFMYSRGFRDLDGHLWNVLHMALEA